MFVLSSAYNKTNIRDRENLVIIYIETATENASSIRMDEVRAEISTRKKFREMFLFYGFVSMSY